MTVTIERVHDAEGAKRWHALAVRSVPFDQPGLVAEPLGEVEEWVTGAHRSELPVLFVASEDGQDVANALVWLPLLENLENASVFFAVDPDRRSRGVGEQLARFLIAFLRTEGRRRAILYTIAPLEGGDGPGGGLATKLGAELAFVGLRRQLDVTALDDAVLEALRKERIGGRADAYELVLWLDAAPEQLVDDAARLMSRMVTDAPMGDLAWEPEVWDATRYREKEAEAAARGQRRVAAGAVERATGRLVAYTDIGVSVIQPTVSHQWDTIVDPEHRGHRLGLLVKIENLLQLRRVSPTTVSVQTYNAESNAHMVGINDELGFCPVEYTRQFQLKL